MVSIVPFRGILYNKEKVKNLSKVISPPYDIVCPDEQRRLSARSAYNVIHLDLNTDTKKYERAAEHFRVWQEKGILVRDEEPLLYVYSQEFLVGKEKRTRTGFFALSMLEKIGTDGSIHPHEFTLAKPKEDRLQLMRACKANFSPIFFLYEDKRAAIGTILKGTMRRAPAIDVNDDKKVRHCLWKLADPRAVAKITEFMKHKQVYIADGHHRYEAAQRYSKEFHEQHPEQKGIQPCDFVLAMFVAKEDKGLVVFPTHRVLRVPQFSWEQTKAKLTQFFAIEQIKTLKELLNLMVIQEKAVVFGMYVDRKFFMLRFRKFRNIEELIREKRALEWKRLDVTILHKVVIEDILRFSEESIKNEEGFRYTRDEQEAKKLVDTGKYDVAFFLNPTKVQQIIDVANAGERMPQKSTYFYPKLINGLVINKFEK